MVARTISPRRSSATPRLGLMLRSFLGWTTNYHCARLRRQGRGLGVRALVRRAAATLGGALGFQPLEVDRRVIGEGHRVGDGGVTLGDQPIHRLTDSPIRWVSL